MEKRLHHRVKEIRVSGGGSRSDAICQITADIFNLPVSRVQTNETSSLGTAISAFVASGVYPDAKTAVANMVRITKTFQPNPQAVEKYDFLYKRVYAKIYPKLLHLYRDIIKFNQ